MAFGVLIDFIASRDLGSGDTALELSRSPETDANGCFRASEGTQHMSTSAEDTSLASSGMRFSTTQTGIWYWHPVLERNPGFRPPGCASGGPVRSLSVVAPVAPPAPTPAPPVTNVTPEVEPLVVSTTKVRRATRNRKGRVALTIDFEKGALVKFSIKRNGKRLSTGQRRLVNQGTTTVGPFTHSCSQARRYTWNVTATTLSGRTATRRGSYNSPRCRKPRAPSRPTPDQPEPVPTRPKNCGTANVIITLLSDVSCQSARNVYSRLYFGGVAPGDWSCAAFDSRRGACQYGGVSVNGGSYITPNTLDGTYFRWTRLF